MMSQDRRICSMVQLVPVPSRSRFEEEQLVLVRDDHSVARDMRPLGRTDDAGESSTITPLVHLFLDLR